MTRVPLVSVTDAITKLLVIGWLDPAENTGAEPAAQALGELLVRSKRQTFALDVAGVYVIGDVIRVEIHGIDVRNPVAGSGASGAQVVKRARTRALVHGHDVDAGIAAAAAQTISKK